MVELKVITNIFSYMFFQLFFVEFYKFFLLYYFNFVSFLFLQINYLIKYLYIKKNWLSFNFDCTSFIRIFCIILTSNYFLYFIFFIWYSLTFLNFLILFIFFAVCHFLSFYLHLEKKAVLSIEMTKVAAIFF